MNALEPQRKISFEDLNPEKLPRHVAFIMDGNGRWARKRKRNRIFGHEEGSNSVRDILKCARRLGIPYLTLYAFSKENWQRPAAEVTALWRLLKRMLKSELSDLVENGIRLRHLGDLERIPADVVKQLERTMAETAQLDKMTVTLAVNYGGGQEIAAAAGRFAADVEAGKRRPEDCTPELFSEYLMIPDVPDPDLLIRTSGEFRISNFLLWQLAYTEIYIAEEFWPEFREAQFLEALDAYQNRERRFGKTSDQLTVA